MADWETVRELAGALPGAEEQTTYGESAFKVDKKLFVWMSPSREAVGALALRVDPDEKPLLIESEGYPIVLVHLEKISRDALAERIEDAWSLRAPKRLLAEYTREG
jgi:hypothetical protein